MQKTHTPFGTLESAYRWLDGHINFERRLDRAAYSDRFFELEEFRSRLARLGNPHLGLRTVHIAGTRGKGSAALILESLLRASGLHVATYTSPHIREYRERIRVDGEMIGAERFTALLKRIALLAPADAEGSRHFKTVFENLTALFFLAAHEMAMDWCVVETGLGGRLDATNVLPPGPVLLTRIGLEHTHLLGENLAAIAAEKAAILKPGGWGVTGAQEIEADGSSAAMDVFRGRAKSVGASIFPASELCPLLETEAHAEGLRATFRFEGEPLCLELGVLGTFQVENIQNALATFARLRAEDLIPRTSPLSIRQALTQLVLPGRMERVCQNPDLYADGGHCPAAAAALAAAMASHFPGSTAGLVVGMMKDKNHVDFFRALAGWPGWRWVCCYTAGGGDRALSGEDLAEAARLFFPNVSCSDNITTSLQEIAVSAEKVDRIIATGTLYSTATLQDWGGKRNGSIGCTGQDGAA